MFAHVREVLQRIESSDDTSSIDAVLPPLRRGLGLDDFGETMISMPLAEFPKLSRVLPRMASEKVQNDWTGSSGLTLLRLSLDFTRSAAYNYTRLTGRPLDGASILDYGCGYGRLARLMYYFAAPKNLFGVDPWDRSIEICHEDGLGENFRQSDFLPGSLPVPTGFSLIYAFSVFTHLSPRATVKALGACRRHIAQDGVLIITIRPIEYWALDVSVHGLADTSELRATHQTEGFAFSPVQHFPAVDGDITYGNTSMTTGWLETNLPDWRIVGVDRSLSDSYQIYVFLRPRT